ncbi:hypothetical protein NHQ30_002804 [Ciborinia camelliae]|nr:hypothetical protein NHQ30_002804 [Ciborinia camelliae]
MLGNGVKFRAGQPVLSQGQGIPLEFHTGYLKPLNSRLQQSNYSPLSPIFSEDLGSQPHYPPQPRPNRMQPPSYPNPHPSDPDGVPTLYLPAVSQHRTQYPPQYPTQYQPQQPPPNQYPQTPIPPSMALTPLQITPTTNSSTSTPAPPQSKLQALPQSQSLESALKDADLESLKALLTASGNLYPHMRTTTLRFLLGDKYVEEEKREGWSIEGLGIKNKVGGESANLGMNGNSSKGKEKSVNSGKMQSAPGKALVIDLVSDDEDCPEKTSDGPERNVGAEIRLAKSLEEERKKMQHIIAKAQETEKQKIAAELALNEASTRRLNAELALAVERQRKETAEKMLEEEKKKAEISQIAFAEEQKTRLSQEKLWMEDQHLVEHYKKITEKDKADVKSLASVAQQYINVVEAGCDARMLEVAKAGSTSKRWTDMYERIYDFGAEINEMAKQPGLAENENLLVEALMMEKKKRATVLAELEVARETIKNVTKNFQSEWRQVENLQQQVNELQAKAIEPQTALSELKARNNTVEQSLQREKRSNGIIQKQLDNERREKERVTELLEKQRRGPISSGRPEYQPNIFDAMKFNILSREKEACEKALEAEKARSEWFREQFADQQIISLGKDEISRELQEEKKKRQAVEKALEVEKKLREITERNLNDERNKVGGSPVAKAETAAGRVLAAVKEEVLAAVKDEVLNRRTRSQTAASEPSSSKKRKLNPT